MNKRILNILLISAVGASVFGGCSFSVDPEKSSLSEETFASNVSEEVLKNGTGETSSEGGNDSVPETDSVQSFMSFTLDGKELTLPFDFSEMESIGWKLWEDTVGIGEYLSDSSDLEFIENDKYDSILFSGSMYRENDKVVMLSLKTYGAGIDLPEYVLSGGITWGSTYDEVTAAYGKPYTEKEDDYSCKYLTYYDDNGCRLYLVIPENGGVAQMELWYSETSENVLYITGTDTDTE